MNIKNNIPSPEELAKEALEAIASDTRTPEEHFENLVKKGIIDRNGRVICAKLFGKGPEQEAPSVPAKNGG